MAVIFLSHASSDAEITQKIKDWLAEQNFQNVFLDFDSTDGIKPGESWERRLYDEIARSQAVILVHTENWLDSKWCFVEFAQARALGKPIFPVILAPLSRPLVTPELQAVDLLDWSEVNRARLERSIRRVTSEVARDFRWDESRSPYPGIHAFERSDAAIFFGRDDETREIVAMLECRRVQGGDRIVLVQGPSGGGKSSVVQAGVLPQLERESSAWIVVGSLRTARTPLTHLAKALAEAASAADQWPKWLERLRDDPRHALIRFADEVRTCTRAQATILLAFDQLEELEASEGDEKKGFLHVIWEALGTAAQLPFMMMGTIRTDASDRLVVDPTFGALRLSTYLLRPVTMQSVRRLIEGPARVASLALENGLSDRILADIDTVDALPLLAFTLRELYERFGRARSAITIANYESLGDPASGLSPIEVALRRKAEDTLRAYAIDGVDLETLRRAFIPHLTRLDDQGRPLRRIARLDAMPQGSERLLHALVEARLLQTSGSAEDLFIEVAHEALFRVWPLLSSWINEEIDFLRLLRQIEQQERFWRDAPEAERRDALLSGLLLARARTTFGREPDRFGPLERFVCASLAADDARRADAQRQRDDILLAQSRMLTRLARDCLARGNTPTAIQLAMSALPTEDMPRPYWPEAKATLHSALRWDRVIAHVDLGTPIDRCLFVDGGTRILAFCGREGSARVIDLVGREQARAEMQTRIKPHRMKQAADLFIMIDEPTDAAETRNFTSNVGIWTVKGQKLGALQVSMFTHTKIDAAARHILLEDRSRLSVVSRQGLVRAELDLSNLALCDDPEISSFFSCADENILCFSLYSDPRIFFWNTAQSSCRSISFPHVLSGLEVAIDGTILVACRGEGVFVINPDETVRFRYDISVDDEHCYFKIRKKCDFAILNVDDGSSYLLGLRENFILHFADQALNFGPDGLYLSKSKEKITLVDRDGNTRVTFANARLMESGFEHFILDKGNHIEIRGGEGELICCAAHDSDIACVALSPDEKHVMTGCHSGTLRVWSIENRPEVNLNTDIAIANLNFVEGAEGLLVVDHEGGHRSLMTATLDRIASGDHTKFWDLVGVGGLIALPHPNGARIQDTRRGISFLIPLETGAEYLRISPESNYILVYSSNERAEVWNVRTGLQEAALVLNGPYQAKFLSDDKIQILNRNHLTIYHVSGSIISSFEVGDCHLGCHRLKLTEELVIIYTEDRVLSVLDHGCNLISRFKMPMRMRGALTNCVELREGHDRAIYRLDGMRLLTLEGESEVTSSPDGARLAIVPDRREGAFLYDADGRLIAEIASSETVARVAFSPNSGHLLTVNGDGHASIWDRNGTLCAHVPLRPARAVAIDDGGERIAVVPIEAPTTIVMSPGLYSDREWQQQILRVAPEPLTEQQRIRYGI